MKRNPAASIIVVILFASAFYAYNNGLFNNPVPDDSGNGQPPTSNVIKVAAFNIQIFGQTKLGKTQVVNTLAQIVRNFDVVLVQEIRDSSQTTAPTFLDVINSMDGPKYAFVESDRLGRSSSKEAYAYFYNTETVQYLTDSAYVYNDSGDVFEREPFIASLRSGNFDFTLIGIHTKPDDAYNEIGNLTVVFDYVESQNNERDVIALGDFNADGSYFKEDSTDNPLRAQGYYWVIGNGVDTMTKTDYTYDRMIMTSYTYSSEYIAGSANVYNFENIYGLNQTFTESISDHFPIYVEFNTSLPDDD
jgi:endonuclease/exonuclease/phosphatase family metal-dependent hydrolase